MKVDSKSCMKRFVASFISTWSFEMSLKKRTWVIRDCWLGFIVVFFGIVGFVNWIYFIDV